MNTLSRIVGWLCLSISSVIFVGFLPGKILGKPGKGGGTAGSLVALIAQLLLLDASFKTLAVLTLSSFLVGWIACRSGEQFMLTKWGPRRRHTGQEVFGDFNETCIDEVHGQFLAALPLWYWIDDMPSRLIQLLFAFVVFRFCDSLKPWPIKAIERRFIGGFGIMLDDTCAAMFPALALIIFHLAF